MLPVEASETSTLPEASTATATACVTLGGVIVEMVPAGEKMKTSFNVESAT